MTKIILLPQTPPTFNNIHNRADDGNRVTFNLFGLGSTIMLYAWIIILVILALKALNTTSLFMI